METTVQIVNKDERSSCLCENDRENDVGRWKFDKKISSANRRVTLLTATSFVLCLLTVAACAYTAFLLNKIEQTRADFVKNCQVIKQTTELSSAKADALVTNGDGDPGATSKDKAKEPHKPQKRRPSRTNNDGKPIPLRIRHNKDKGQCRIGKKKTQTICKCCVKKVTRKLTKLGIMSLVRKSSIVTTATPETDNHIDKYEQLYVAAAHYMTYVDEDFITNEFGPLDPGDLESTVSCHRMAKWNGVLCRNRTFSTPAAPENINVFREADWMENVNNTERLFDKTDDGTFIALHTGIYLLYAHVLFYDLKTRQAIAIYHDPQAAGVNRGNTFKCMESIDYINPELSTRQNARYKSCSVTAVVHMTKGDIVTVKNLYPNTRMDLTKDSTYFGGLLIASHTGT